MNGTPVASAETLGNRVDAFRLDKKSQLATGDIAQVTFDEYETACKVIEAHFGRGRATASIVERDFSELRVALSKGKKKPTLGPHTLKRRLIIARMVFPEAAKTKQLKIPSKRLLRAASGIKSARRTLLKMTPDYVVEFVWIMSKYKACRHEDAAALLQSPSMRGHIAKHRERLDECMVALASGS
jgi:hypothetical protein